MDETTHAFSRKVIDRAITLDFGSFFPNDFGQYFESRITNRGLTFPVRSRVTRADLAVINVDSDGEKSISFLRDINEELKNSPFEVAFRALNELLLALVCFGPTSDLELEAVWDDFLMTKILPRIEGDGAKLQLDGNSSLITRVAEICAKKFPLSWDDERPDLLRLSTSGASISVRNRSKVKLEWMQTRLASVGFTSFWP
jgi:hypothetical protein